MIHYIKTETGVLVDTDHPECPDCREEMECRVSGIGVFRGWFCPCCDTGWDAESLAARLLEQEREVQAERQYHALGRSAEVLYPNF